MSSGGKSSIVKTEPRPSNTAQDAQQKKIVEFNNTIDSLTEDKYALQAEYRKLEAEVGPIKYLAEFIYGETNEDILEEAVRWVIIVIIFVFDPLAVLLLIASQATFEMRRAEGNKNDNESNDNIDVEYAQSGDFENRHNETEPAIDTPRSEENETNINSGEDEGDSTQFGAEDDGGIVTERLLEPEQEARRVEIELREQSDQEWKDAKRVWKLENPDQTAKDVKEQYILGDIDFLPWDKSYIAKDEKGKQYTGYVQNNEQNDSSIWQKIGNDDKD